MRNRELRRLLPRFLILGLLVAATVMMVKVRPVLATACSTCDSNYYSARTTCFTDHYYCLQSGNHSTAECDAIEAVCKGNANNAYNNCLIGCTFVSPPPSGGGGSGCGRGRTACELDCADAKDECAQDQDRETCGAEYESCMSACCP